MENVTVVKGNNVRPTGKYDNKAGKVASYVDPTLISPQAVKTAGIRKQAVAGATAGNRAQRARVVQYNFARLLEQAELCDDNGRN
jgi:hypothetical protein